MDKVYYLLSSLYGDELHDFLLGVNGMNDTNLFNVMFVVLVIISMGLIPGFYYKLFLVNVIWVHCLGDMMVDEEGEELTIGLTNIVGYGFASAILATFLFFVASLGWKTQSINCSSTPF